jgi:hypothetical protein
VTLELFCVDGSQGDHGFGNRDLLAFLNVEYFRLGYDDATPAAQDVGIAVELLSEGRSKEVDLKFYGEDLHVFRNYGECGIARGVIGHRSHYAGMDKTILLPVIGCDFKTRVKPAPGRVHCFESTELDKPAFVVALQKIDSFAGYLLSRHGSSSENPLRRQIIAILKNFATGFGEPFTHAGIDPSLRSVNGGTARLVRINGNSVVAAHGRGR